MTRFLRVLADFYTTPAGKKQFSDNLLSIQLCVQETVSSCNTLRVRDTPRCSLSRVPDRRPT